MSTLTCDVFSGEIAINSNTIINIQGNDFSKLNTKNNGIVASGVSHAEINLAYNYWGSSLASQIDSMIEDYNDNTALPWGQLYSRHRRHQQHLREISIDRIQHLTTTGEHIPVLIPIRKNGNPVTGGTVTFTILNGSKIIGTPTTPQTVTQGSASAKYELPPGTPPGTYIIQASYSGYYTESSSFLPSTDTSHFLTINPAPTSVALLSTPSPTFSAVSDQTVDLSANVTSPGGTVDEGMVTFTIFPNGDPSAGSSVTYFVNSSGNASGTYKLLAGTAGWLLVRSRRNTAIRSTSRHQAPVAHGPLPRRRRLSATPPAPRRHSMVPRARASPYPANVASSAGTINGGAVTFTITNASDTQVASQKVTELSGVASQNITLNPGTPGGVTRSTAVYDGTTSFAPSSPSDSTLTVAAANTATSPADITATYGPSGTTIALSAMVTSGSVNITGGTVIFTVRRTAARSSRPAPSPFQMASLTPASP